MSEQNELSSTDKLRIRPDGWIEYRIYAQDGTFIPMEIQDTLHNRRFVSWVQIHDRYTEHGEP